MVALFFIFFFLFFILIIGLAVINIMSLWKIFEKANEPGWAALIPFYNGYVLLKIVGMNPYWILVSVGVNVIGQIVSVISYITNLNGILTIPFSILNMTISIYLLISISINLSRCFNKSSGFTIGLIFLAPVFYAILGFGKDEYVGPNPMKDYLFKNETPVTTRYCLGCGKKVANESINFCPYCGKSLKETS